MATCIPLQTKSGTKFRYQIARKVNGKTIRRSKCFTTKTDGKRWASANEIALVPTTRTTLHAALDRYIKEVCPLKRSAVAEAKRVERFKLQLPDGPLSSITPAVINEWIAARLLVNKSGSVRRDFNSLGAFFTKCTHEFKAKHGGEGWGYVETNPTRRCARPGKGLDRKRIVTQAELDEFLAACVNDDERRVAAAFAFACETGLRRGELLNIGNEQRVRCAEKFVELFDGYTKSGKGRKVPLTAKARGLLPVGGFGFKPDTFSRIFRAVTKRVGKDYVFHSARHTAATRFGQSGKVSPYELKDIFGWATLEQAATYVTNSIESVADRFD